MKPFLRPTDRGRLAPVGWISEPAGQWAGKAVDVVYDPRRHQILLVRNDVGDDNLEAIAGTGYRRIAAADNQELWMRDRTEAAQAQLDHLERGPLDPHIAEIAVRSR